MINVFLKSFHGFGTRSCWIRAVFTPWVSTKVWFYIMIWRVRVRESLAFMCLCMYDCMHECMYDCMLVLISGFTIECMDVHVTSNVSA